MQPSYVRGPERVSGIPGVFENLRLVLVTPRARFHEKVTLVQVSYCPPAVCIDCVRYVMRSAQLVSDHARAIMSARRATIVSTGAVG